MSDRKRERFYHYNSGLVVVVKQTAGSGKNPEIDCIGGCLIQVGERDVELIEVCSGGGPHLPDKWWHHDDQCCGVAVMPNPPEQPTTNQEAKP